MTLTRDIPAAFIKGNPPSLQLRAAVLSRASDIQCEGDARPLFIQANGETWPTSEAQAEIFTPESLAAKLDMPQDDVVTWLGHLLTEGYVERPRGLRAFTLLEDGRRWWVKAYRLTELGNRWLRAWYEGKAL